MIGQRESAVDARAVVRGNGRFCGAAQGHAVLKGGKPDQPRPRPLSRLARLAEDQGQKKPHEARNPHPHGIHVVGAGHDLQRHDPPATLYDKDTIVKDLAAQTVERDIETLAQITNRALAIVGIA